VSTVRLSHLPLRVAIGGYVLNSGLSKRNLEGEAAEGMYGMAVAAIPALQAVDAPRFARLLAAGEIALGSALLVPAVPSAVVGAGLVAFSAGLVQLYVKTPGMRQPGSLRPSPEGIGLAKDVWLLGAGLTLLVDGLVPRRGVLRR
jgi:hypothetical protein